MEVVKMLETMYNLKEVGLKIVDFAYMNKYIDMSEYNDIDEEKQLLKEQIKKVIEELNNILEL